MAQEAQALRPLVPLGGQGSIGNESKTSPKEPQWHVFGSVVTFSYRRIALCEALRASCPPLKRSIETVVPQCRRYYPASRPYMFSSDVLSLPFLPFSQPQQPAGSLRASWKKRCSFSCTNHASWVLVPASCCSWSWSPPNPCC